jgi:hypothetical protein
VSFYSHYRGRFAGRVYHFLDEYVSLDCAEQATIGAAHVNYRGETIATFTWDTRFGYGDVPIFAFIGESADDRERAQATKRERAISDACLLNYVEPTERKPVDLDVMMALLDGGTRSARIFGLCVHKAEPSFYVHKRHVYFDAAGRTYRWDREIGGWLLWVEGQRRAA